MTALTKAIEDYNAQVPARWVVDLMASIMTPREALDYVAGWRNLERRLSAAVSEARRKERVA